MDIFIDWINQIIIFIILAAVIDMLIPSTKFEKYVRLVIGLIFLLIFIRPIFLVFGTDVTTEVNKLTEEIFDVQKSEEAFSKSIDFKKREIESNQRAYILEKMAVQLKNKVEPQLKKEHHVEIISLDFRFTDENEPTEENLEEVVVHLNPLDEAEIKEQKGDVKQIEKVQVSRTNDKTTQKPDIEPIQAFLQEAWELSENKLSIDWGEG